MKPANDQKTQDRQQSQPFQLYQHWRSSSSWRVRWALRLKGVAHDNVMINLVRDEHLTDAHRRRNPFATVPVLQIGDLYLSESVAIIEYLDEMYPEPKLLPGDAIQRARIRRLVQIINAGTQPLQNLSVLRHVSPDPEVQRTWARHFIKKGLDAYEALAAQTAGTYSVGDVLTLADLFLIPQCANARRFGLDVATWPRIAAIEARCLATQEAQESSPDRQPH